jgi:hypothetical protein
MKKTAIEVLEEHMKDANGDLTVWQEEWIVTAMEEYAQQQVNSVDLADVGGNEVAVCKHEWDKLDWDSNVRIDCECGESFYRFTN